MAISLIYYEPPRYKEQFEKETGSCPRHMLILLLEGSFSCRTQGTEYRAERGQVACFPPNVPFERKVEKPICYIQIGFYVAEGDPCAAALPAGLLSVDKDQVESIGRKIEHAPAFYEHLTSFLITQHYLNSSSSAFQKQSSDREMECVISYFFEHMSEKINMEELAKTLHLSYTGFLWKFRRTMDCTPLEYLQHIRLQKAKQLLVEGDLRINEIASCCGYNNAYYFTNTFHKVYGISPKEFRIKNTQR